MTDTTNLQMTLVPSGTLQQWVPVNAALVQLDAAVAGTLSIAMADANLTLSEAQYQNSALRFTGSLTAGRDVVLPSHFPHIHVTNSTGQTLTFKKSGQTGITVTNGNSAMIAAGVTDVVQVSGGGGSVSDGDKGDITVSGGGTTWTIDADVVTYAKMQNVSATQRVLGRNTAGAGDVEEVTLSQFLDWVGSAANGDILYRTGGAWARLAVGSNGQVLTVASSLPSWAAAGGGGLTNWTDGLNTSAPNATIPVATFTATNAATSVDAALLPKGVSGALLADIPDNSSSGGNKRGAHAVDWQIDRGAASQVASGSNSVISGGSSCTASGQNSAVGGGTTNSAEAIYACIPGGSSNTADGDYTFVTGHSAHARGILGHRAHANGTFSLAGEAQDGKQLLRNTTTNATQTTLTADAGAASTTNQLNLTLNFRSHVIKGTINAYQKATGDAKSWEFTAHIKRDSGVGSTAMVAACTPTIIAETGPGGGGTTVNWTVAVDADTTNGCLRVRVTGEASKTIRWLCDAYTANEIGWT